MKEEDLINKLESTQPPEVELPSHKSRLKIALLKYKNPAQDKGRGITDLLRDAFIPRRRVWQTALISSLAIALIVSLSVVLPPLFGEDNKALAKDIALNDPEVQALIGDNELGEDDIEVIDNVDEGYASVFIKVSADSIIVANFFMGIPGGEEVEVIETEIVPITDAKNQEIIDIASTDPKIKVLLDQGAHIYQYYFDYVPAYLVSDSISDLFDKVKALQPLSVKDQEVICDELVEVTIRCWMELNGTEYFFMLEMMGKTILMDLTELGPFPRNEFATTTTAATTTTIIP